ncbi:uncharacterized protein PADG_03812 [Paracoccidioides brasiliensis Pb18]|uniref:Deacetylase sirtuin-type domain-containing protein n=1 Tax=Paracoccidioides brasiliensis (strain Pb18) TaxID=502780 RepID=C1G976_PARBD|nr:uncharacterized protein PADG_03812 [Paracoccidioides brasiliensis Pb18]EEH47728.1 hypothetical protein PADG_03812 [Paracoccidioides brasiliensis Pb18]
MGNEISVPVDEKTPPETLKSRSLEGIVDYIKEKNVRRIVVLTGAGISTAAGIPDFRSPDTGIYANLARLNLPHPEAVFDISYFRKNPRPFYSLSKEMFPGRYRPTIAHTFIKLLYDKGLLLKLFTQNIDCLERQAGVPGGMIVEAHGSYATHSCIDCKSPYPDDLMRKAIESNDIPLCLKCCGFVKPDIVFFGESLPESFFMNRTLTTAAELCIIMGTSLTVQPFASLPSLCKEGVPRLLINLNRVGGLGSRPDDVLLLGECDDGVLKLADALGWRDELEELWAKVNPEKTSQMQEDNRQKQARTRDEKLRDEVERLTEEVERMLHLSRSHEDRVRLELEAEQQKGGVHWKAQKLDKSESTDRSADDGNQDREIERGSETSIPEQAADKVREHQAQPKPIGAAAQKGESSPPLLKQPNQDTGQKTGVR